MKMIASKNRPQIPDASCYVKDAWLLFCVREARNLENPLGFFHKYHCVELALQIAWGDFLNVYFYSYLPACGENTEVRFTCNFHTIKNILLLHQITPPFSFTIIYVYHSQNTWK